MSIPSCRFIRFNSFMSIYSFQFMRFNSCVSISSFQIIHVDSFVSIHSCQFLHGNSFMSIYSFQFIHVNSFMSIHAFQFMRFNSCGSIPSFQIIHVNWFMSIDSFHAFHFNSFQFISIHFNSLLSNSPWIPSWAMSLFWNFRPGTFFGRPSWYLRSKKLSVDMGLHGWSYNKIRKSMIKSKNDPIKASGVWIPEQGCQRYVENTVKLTYVEDVARKKQSWIIKNERSFLYHYIF